MMENVKTLVDAFKDDSGSLEEALKEVSKSIQGSLKSNGVTDISEKLVEILEGKLVDESKASLIAAKEVAVSVPESGGGGSATIAIDLGNNGKGDSKGTVTITADDGGILGTYPCIVNDDGTITLEGAGQGGQNAVIEYVINEDKKLVLNDLDEIAIIAEEYDDNSTPSTTAVEVVENSTHFQEGFLDDSVSDADLTMMVITLILARVGQEEDLDAYLDTWKDGRKNIKTGANLDDDEKIIAAAVNGMIERGEISGNESELTGMLKDLLGQNE
jgi:hypothetical protein